MLVSPRDIPFPLFPFFCHEITNYSIPSHSMHDGRGGKHKIHQEKLCILTLEVVESSIFHLHPIYTIHLKSMTLRCQQMPVNFNTNPLCCTTTPVSHHRTQPYTWWIKPLHGNSDTTDIKDLKAFLIYMLWNLTQVLPTIY